MAERIGKRTVEFKNVYVHSYAAVVGKKEGEGPMKDWFDKIYTDEYMNSKSFEQAESKFQKQVLETALKKGNMSATELDYVLAGDLLNQCIGSSFGIRDMGVPFLGLYGACSTMAESMAVAASFVNAGYYKNIVAATGSHFSTAERQYRYPLELGCTRPPQAQWTVTGYCSDWKQYCYHFSDDRQGGRLWDNGRKQPRCSYESKLFELID